MNEHRSQFCVESRRLGVQRGRRQVLDQRHYVQYDNFNVTSLLDASGDVLE
jgi:hypothetical protein